MVRGLIGDVCVFVCLRLARSTAVMWIQLVKTMVRSCSRISIVSIASVMEGSCRKIRVKYV